MSIFGPGGVAKPLGRINEGKLSIRDRCVSVNSVLTQALWLNSPLDQIHDDHRAHQCF
jgi:hypothetical protein